MYNKIISTDNADEEELSDDCLCSCHNKIILTDNADAEEL